MLTGTAAANQAGPAITMSYLAAGLACAFAALCYADFASMIPIAGSAHTYAYATIGELVAWTMTRGRTSSMVRASMASNPRPLANAMPTDRGVSPQSPAVTGSAI